MAPSIPMLLDATSSYGWPYVATVLLAVLVSRLVRGSWTWWKNMRIQHLMQQQGVLGPPLTFRTLFVGHAQGMLQSRTLAIRNDLPLGSHDVESRTQAFTYHARKRYGDPFLYWWGPDATLSTLDFDLVKSVLSTNFSSFVVASQLKNIRAKMFGETGLLLQEGHIWAQHRRLLTPAFQTTKLKGMAETANTCVAILINKWEQRVEAGGGTAVIDVSVDFSSLAADVLARTAFGSSYEAGQKIFNLGTELSVLMVDDVYYNSIPLLKYLPTARNKLVAATRRALEDNIRASILEHLKAGPSSDDLLGLIVQVGREYDKPGTTSGKFSVNHKSLQYILDESRSFYFAGHETINAGLQWIMMLLSLHPEWQEKARREVDEVTQGKPGVTADMVSKLKVVTMVVLETLRLYPPATNVARQAVKDVQIGHLFIPKGLCIHTSPLAMHTQPDNWGQDALQFNPERFKDGIRGACKNPTAYMPFSSGPRICLGQAFAMLQIKTVVARMLQNFKFSLHPSYRHAPHSPFVLKPEFGVPLVISKR